ncbi:MAG: hypothetical protein ACRETN_12110 [Nevskiales bacterium]
MTVAAIVLALPTPSYSQIYIDPEAFHRGRMQRYEEDRMMREDYRRQLEFQNRLRAMDVDRVCQENGRMGHQIATARDSGTPRSRVDSEQRQGLSQGLMTRDQYTYASNIINTIYANQKMTPADAARYVYRDCVAMFSGGR